MTSWRVCKVCGDHFRDKYGSHFCSDGCRKIEHAANRYLELKERRHKLNLTGTLIKRAGADL